MAFPRNVSFTFTLSGVPELGDNQTFLAFPLCVLYTIALLGNSTILYVIHGGEGFRQPMYILLSMLALTDLAVSLTSLPTMLGIFCFNYNQVHFESCLTQMFFLHTFAAMESGVLVAMAVDRLIAIWDPLRYASILTSSVIAKFRLVIVIRGICVVFPVPILTRRFPFCKSHVLLHSYCLHQDVIRLACADTAVNSWYGLIAVLLTKGVDSMFIVVSYGMILWTVFGIKTNDARIKAFNTCVCHMCAVLLFYIPLIGLSVVHRFGKHAAPLVPILMADIYLLVPPVINPVIYSIKTKQIRRKILKVLKQPKVGIPDNGIAVITV
ncbi:olfactory receptor 51H1-like [Spea bombifrons]|uniref:olfactory receptor 51H1-like n=1 Tax=Spea bombifrons TaxID=233779 RepID=UPI0023499754|nr:olfactory receptor 51H1-like [Spea bombifrons]